MNVLRDFHFSSSELISSTSAFDPNPPLVFEAFFLAMLLAWFSLSRADMVGRERVTGKECGWVRSYPTQPLIHIGLPNSAQVYCQAG